jgi:hypothetical protein
MGEDQALARLHAILAHPEFQVDDSTPWWQQLLAPVFNFIWDALGQLVQLVLDGSSGREGALGIVVLVVSAAVLAFAAVYLIRAVRLSVVRESRLQSAGLAERRARSDALWRTAQQKAAAGELAEAVRLAYLSALYALDERALLQVETSLTNREHARRLSNRYPALGDGFGQLVASYEQMRFGRVPVAADTFQAFGARAQGVRSAALEAEVGVEGTAA